MVMCHSMDVCRYLPSPFGKGSIPLPHRPQAPHGHATLHGFRGVGHDQTSAGESAEPRFAGFRISFQFHQATFADFGANLLAKQDKTIFCMALLDILRTVVFQPWNCSCCDVPQCSMA